MPSELAKGFLVLTKEHLRLHLWPQLASTQILHSCAMQSCSSRCCGKTHTFVAGTVFALAEKNQVHEGSERSYFMLFQAWRARLKLWCPKLLGLLSKKFRTFVAKADWLSKWRSDSSWSMWHMSEALMPCNCIGCRSPTLEPDGVSSKPWFNWGLCILLETALNWTSKAKALGSNQMKLQS